jgi:hypothetical protein
VVILGNFQGVETGLRQLRRTLPLETMELDIGGSMVRVPTVAEMIRVKGWMALTRNAFRDYLDVAALTDHAGSAGTIAALTSFDACYQDVDHRAVARDTSPLLQLAGQLAEPKPGDLQHIAEVSRYKGIIERWDSWAKIESQCRRAALWSTEALLKAGVQPSS